MTEGNFEGLLEDCIDHIKKTLGDKNEEYSRGGDKLHNFKRAALVGETTPCRALLGMKLKHDVSILDVVDDLEQGRVHSIEHLMEKFGDAVNYTILLLAIVIEGTERD